MGTEDDGTVGESRSEKRCSDLFRVGGNLAFAEDRSAGGVLWEGAREGVHHETVDLFQDAAIGYALTHLLTLLVP